MTDSPHVFDATQANFEADIVNASFKTPVLVDFWAPWCAPCRQLKPVLEKLAESLNGALKLAKINTDQEMQLAAMFGIRSLPTVVLFKDGQMIDGFMGALPESALREFLARHMDLAAESGGEAAEAAAALPTAPELPVESAAATAERLRAEIAAEPAREELKFELIDALLRAGDTDAADSELATLPIKLAEDAKAKRLASRLGFARALQGAPGKSALAQRLTDTPDDHRARHQLGVRLLLEGDAEAALEAFLELLRRDRQFDDGLAKKTLLAAFSLIEDADLVSRYRRKMASLLF